VQFFHQATLLMTDNPETLYVFYNNEITAFQPNDRDFHIGNCEFQKEETAIEIMSIALS
jgi:hypothetical protein